METYFDKLYRYRKYYLFVAGTILPAIVANKVAKHFAASQSTQNIATIAGLIIGGIITKKFLQEK